MQRTNSRWRTPCSSKWSSAFHSRHLCVSEEWVRAWVWWWWRQRRRCWHRFHIISRADHFYFFILPFASLLFPFPLIRIDLLYRFLLLLILLILLILFLLYIYSFRCVELRLLSISECFVLLYISNWDLPLVHHRPLTIPIQVSRLECDGHRTVVGVRCV